MRLTTVFLAILAAAIVPSAGRAERQRDWNIRVAVDNSTPLTRCDQMTASSRFGEMARDEETQTIPTLSDGLRVKGFANGGVYVRGGSETQYTVRLCKFAVAATAAEARTRVEALTLSVRNGAVSVEGSAEHDRMAHLIVIVPKEARLDVEAHNGPLSLDSIDGRIAARVTNGPASLRRSKGDIQVDALNGPLDVSGASGNVRATAQNGPMGVTLSGRGWDGAGLTAHAMNGPLSLRVPDHYETGVLVETSGHSPFDCRAALCSGASVRSGEPWHARRFGPANATVRVSAQNGPVSIVTHPD